MFLDSTSAEQWPSFVRTGPSATIATEEETLLFIERHRLVGKGIGYLDAHLLTSVNLTEAASLWTLDKRLAAIATALRIG